MNSADLKQLSGILEYRNVESGKVLAGKAQYTADRMEYMTLQMNQEAIFMRIITLVTLFFLPGTFVSVSLQDSLITIATDELQQTLMSTDVVQWQTPAPGRLEKVISRGAIETFLVITIPCMILTFSAAYGFFRWSKWNKQKILDRQDAELMPP